MTENIAIAGHLPVAQPDNLGTFAVTPWLLQYWQAALRWRWLIVGIVISAVAVGLVLTLLTAKRYTAYSQIQVSREQKNVTNVQGLDSQDAGRDLEFYATQYSLLKAKSVADRVSAQLRLASTDAFFEAHGVKPIASRSDGAGNPGERAKSMRLRERQVSQLLLDNIEIVPVRGSSLVNIGYTSRVPDLSAKITNTWVLEFISASMDRQFASTADARAFLEERLAQLRTKLEQSEREAVLFAAGHDIVTLETQRDASGKQISQRTMVSTDLEGLNQALIAAKAERIAAESRLIRGNAASNPEVLASQTIGQMRAKRAEFAADYAKILVQFDAGYPGAIAIKRQIDSLDAAIANEVGRTSTGRSQAYREAAEREQQMQAKVNATKAQYEHQRQDSIQYNIFQREADTNRQLYDALLQRYKEIGVAGGVGVNNIAIVDKAEVPNKPSGPNLPINFALALLIGLALATFAVLALEQIDEGFRSPEDVRNVLGLPLLGNVPRTTESPLQEIIDPKSSVSEAYFSIRSTLAFSTTHGLPKSLCLTSTQAGEGKSTSSDALAKILARTGKNVLLIDGDLRSPSIHEFVGVGNERGFSNLLAGDEFTGDVIHRLPNQNLSVLTTGPVPPNPAELLSGDRFGAVLAMLQERFDHVVIDAPPVLGLADAPLMGRAVEGVIFVIEAERTSRRTAKSAVQRLTALGDHVLGVIVTKVESNRHSYGYGYGYGEKYGENDLK